MPSPARQSAGQNIDAPINEKTIVTSALDSKEPPLYYGGCHCGFTAYEVRPSLTEPPADGPPYHPLAVQLHSLRIVWIPGSSAKAGDFKLLTPEGGESELTSYRFNNRSMNHPFCPKCGINCYAAGTVTVDGVVYPMFRLNAQTLQGRRDGKPLEEFKDVQTHYWNGRDETGFSRWAADFTVSRRLGLGRHLSDCLYGANVCTAS